MKDRGRIRRLFWLIPALALGTPGACGAAGPETGPGGSELPSLAAVVDAARAAAARPSAVEAAPAGGRADALRSSFEEFARTAQSGGVPALVALRKADDPVAAERFQEMSVVDSGDPRFPLALEIGGKRISLLKEWLGEGHHSRAFLSDHGTVIKLTKQPSSARGLLMAAWTAPILEARGIRVAKVRRVDPAGLYLEQEYVSGPSLKQRMDDEWGDQLPPALRDQVVRALTTNLDLAEGRGIALNIKADAFQLGPDGGLILVDLTPSDSRLEEYRTLFAARARMGEDRFEAELFHFFRRGTKHEKPTDMNATEENLAAARRQGSGK